MADTKQFYKPTLIEEIYGTWVNEEYSGGIPQKMVLYDWGYCERFSKASDTTPRARWTMTILDKWTDAEGNIWYQAFARYDFGESFYYLCKISRNKQVLEYAYKTIGIPSEEDFRLRRGGHLLYYRQ